MMLLDRRCVHSGERFVGEKKVYPQGLTHLGGEVRGVMI